jgi:hypothetical protein
VPDNLDGPDRDIYALLGNDFGLGWWPGANVVSRQHSYEEEGITRFALLIADPARILELTSAPD